MYILLSNYFQQTLNLRERVTCNLSNMLKFMYMSFEVFAVMNVQIVVLCAVTQFSQRILLLLCP